VNADPSHAAEFFTPEERSLAERFATQGHLVIPVEDRPALDRLRGFVVDRAARFLGADPGGDPGDFLDGIHHRVAPDKLNEFRLSVIGDLNEAEWARPAYFRLARGHLGTIVGNELAMQRRFNLSVQLPDDESSLLPIHSDVWAGDSPFEVVLWVPLVDCRRTKSMFIVDPETDRRIQRDLARFDGRGVEDLFRAVEPRIQFLDVAYGEVLLFTQNLMHGNRVNREPGTRWSINMRFKSLLSPYADKRLGEFFEPITLRPATRFGLEHRLPEGFHE